MSPWFSHTLQLFAIKKKKKRYFTACCGIQVATQQIIKKNICIHTVMNI